jgi:hypothetical protein
MRARAPTHLAGGGGAGLCTASAASRVGLPLRRAVMLGEAVFWWQQCRQEVSKDTGQADRGMLYITFKVLQ